MAKGIIYCMSTVVPGLIKIGKTGTENYGNRMYYLEKNGYSNVVGLKREFAIEVNEYDEKEKLLMEIFSKSRVPNTELFALDIEMVKLLLSSLDGKKIYPPEKSKREVFKDAKEEIKIKSNSGTVPDGEYYLRRSIRNFGKVHGKAIVVDGVFTVLKGSYCANTSKGFVPEVRKNAPILDNILQQDVICSSPSSAGWLVIGRANNGWKEWKDQSGKSIDVYRQL